MTATQTKGNDMTAITSPKVGQLVQIDPAQAGKWLGVTMTVKSVLRTNVVLTVPGDVRGLKCPISLLVEPVAAEEASDAANAAHRAKMDELLSQPALYPGTLFTLKNRPGLWVVIGQSNSLKYRAARLGGDAGRYLTNIAYSTMTVIEPSAIAEVESLLG